MRPASFLVALLATSLAVAACGTSAGPPPATSPTLDGRTFLSTNVTGRILVPGTTIRLTFDAGSLGVHAGCNSMGGIYALDVDRLIVRDFAMTEMACDPPLMAQDQWIVDLLTGGVLFALDGDTLTLEGAGMRLTLLDRRVADPDRPLVGTHWRLEGIVSGDAVSSLPLGVRAGLVIVDGRVDLEAGCNSGGGTVAIGDGTISFGPIGLTKIGCDPQVMAVEQAVTTVLSREVRYMIDADVLTLDAGGIGLILRAAD